MLIADGMLSIIYLACFGVHSLSRNHNLLLILAGILFGLSMNQLSRTINLRSKNVTKYISPIAIFPLFIVLWEIFIS